MTLSSADREVVHATLKSLSKSLLETRSLLDKQTSPALHEDLKALWEQQVQSALRWMELNQGDVPTDIMLSGSARLVERMPAPSGKPLKLSSGQIRTLTRVASPGYLDICIRRGLPTSTLPLFVMHRISQTEGPKRKEWEALLERPEMNSEPALNMNGQGAWMAISDYEQVPDLKITFLRKQIAAFPEHFSSSAEWLSRDGRKCAPLLILALCGAPIRELTPPKSKTTSAARMRHLCKMLSSNHGLMQLHAAFDPIEETLPQLQSRMDRFFRAKGLHD